MFSSEYCSYNVYYAYISMCMYTMYVYCIVYIDIYSHIIVVVVF